MVGYFYTPPPFTPQPLNLYLNRIYNSLKFTVYHSQTPFQMECENEASVLFQTWYFVLVLGWEKEELQQWALCDNFGIKRKSILGGSGSMPPPPP